MIFKSYVSERWKRIWQSNEGYGFLYMRPEVLYLNDWEDLAMKSSERKFYKPGAQQVQIPWNKSKVGGFEKQAGLQSPLQILCYILLCN